QMLAFGRDTITALDKNGNPYAVKTQSVAAAYTPGKGWRALTPPASSGAAPQMRDRAVWTGTEMLVWGANVAYNPATNSWRRLPASNVRLGLSSAVWDGKELIVGGFAYDPAADSWRRLPAAHVGRSPAAVWDGNRVLLVSGAAGGSSYSPADNAWTPLPPAP